MTGVENLLFIAWRGIIWDRGVNFSKLIDRGATGVHLTWAFKQGVCMCYGDQKFAFFYQKHEHKQKEVTKFLPKSKNCSFLGAKNVYWRRLLLFLLLIHKNNKFKFSWIKFTILFYINWLSKPTKLTLWVSDASLKISRVCEGNYKKKLDFKTALAIPYV